MSTAQEKKEAISYSLEILKRMLEEVEDQLDLDADNITHKPHLVKKRTELLRAIEIGEELLK